MKFGSVDLLKQQVMADIETARAAVPHLPDPE
jgi:FAD synthase